MPKISWRTRGAHFKTIYSHDGTDYARARELRFAQPAVLAEDDNSAANESSISYTYTKIRLKKEDGNFTEFSNELNNNGLRVSFFDTNDTNITGLESWVRSSISSSNYEAIEEGDQFFTTRTWGDESLSG